MDALGILEAGDDLKAIMCVVRKMWVVICGGLKRTLAIAQRHG